MPRMLTITFHGLCLFAPSRDGRRCHVFLAQPLDEEHRTVRCYKRSDHSWTGEEVARGSSFEFGVLNPDPSVKVGMPGTDEMANLCDMPDGGSLSEGAAVPSRTDERGSHIILNGGKLTVIDEIGLWEAEGEPGKSYPLPHMVQWTGEVEETDQSGWMEFWNSMTDETPEPVKKNEIPKPHLKDEEAARRAAMHFAAYFRITGGKPRKIRYKEKKHAKSTCAPPRPMPVSIGPKTIIVSSCPSLAITLGE